MTALSQERELRANMKELTFSELKASINIVHGNIVSGKRTLFSIVFNEKFFLTAFLDYYRSIGVEQFLFFDDKSSDGTTELLIDQPDCVLLNSNLRYGEVVIIHGGGPVLQGKNRAGRIIKNAVLSKYLFNQYAIYADADEFLFLPPGPKDVRELFSELEKSKQEALPASLVEFYPRALEVFAEGASAVAPASFAELLQMAPFFDSHPLISVRPDSNIKRIGKTASRRLYEKFAIETATEADYSRNFFRRIMRKKTREISPFFKTPIIKTTDTTWLKGTHRASVKPTSDRFLCIAHFKFTPDFPRKVAESIKNKAHHNQSITYVAYDKLLRSLKNEKEGFIYRKSKRYTGVSDLERAGLMKWYSSSMI